MDNNLSQIKKEVYEKAKFDIIDFNVELESKEYNACRFKINGQNIICRSSKITPKKIGQFVTFWKRNKNGIIEPLSENDSFNFYVINVRKENRLGQFVLPKPTLIAKGIISTPKKDGKRGFRVYPSWDKPINKQAVKTQKWQLNYFYEIGQMTDLSKVNELYK